MRRRVFQRNRCAADIQHAVPSIRRLLILVVRSTECTYVIGLQLPICEHGVVTARDTVQPQVRPFPWSRIAGLDVRRFTTDRPA